jgi:hypothetical protein
METDNEAKREYARRLNLPGVEARYMPTGRTGLTVVLTQRGKDIATKLVRYTRAVGGKIASETYFLPPID